MSKSLSLSCASASTLLNDAITEIKGRDENRDKLTLGFCLSLFKQRSFAGIFFVLGLLCLLPGVSILAGFVMILPSMQMILGFKIPALPRFIEKQEIAVQRILSCSIWLMPKIQWIEKFVKPRYLFLSSGLALYAIGLVSLLLAIIVAVPFPLSNFLPALAMLCTSIGMLERDGVLIMIGFFISLTSFAVSIAVVRAILMVIVF